MKRVRAGAIIVNKDKVLLLWRKVNGNEYFVFPGGGQEEGETLEETVAREAKEETSLAVKVEKFLYKLIDENTEQNFYLCSYISGEPKLGDGNEVQDSSESNQYKPMWKEMSELPNLPLIPFEVREWFVEDHKKNFTGDPRDVTILIKDRRIS